MCWYYIENERGITAISRNAGALINLGVSEEKIKTSEDFPIKEKKVEKKPIRKETLYVKRKPRPELLTLCHWR